MTTYRVFEIRNYQLLPQRRAEFVDHFERHLIHPQEALGIAVLGQFEPVGHADRFVWIRAFVDMAARGQALAAFYEESDAWKRHGPLANDIMCAWDDVYLLRPTSTTARVTAGYAPGAGAPPVRPSRDARLGVVVTTEGAAATDFSSRRAQDLAGRLDAVGGHELDRFSSEPVANDFTRLPVKQDKGTVVSLVTIPADSVDEARATLEAFAGTDGRVWMLKPTSGSFLPRTRIR